MYGGRGGGEGFASVIPTAGGIAVLPNTGGNQLLFVLSLVSIIVGSLILATTTARFIARMIYKV